MKRALIYLSVVALVLAAIYWSVNRLTHFVDADDTSGTPAEASEAAVAEQPTVAPPPTLEPSPIPPSPLPPTAVPTMVQPTIAPPTVVPPTAIPPTLVPPTEVPTLIPATEVPTLVVITEVIAPTILPTSDMLLAEAAPTSELPAPTQALEPTGEPATDGVLSTDVLLTPTFEEPTIVATVELSPTFARGEGLETTPVVSGGQSSVDSPVAVPPTTAPVPLPTATIFQLQPTVAATVEQPMIEPSPVLPTPIPSLVPSPNPELTPVLAQVTGTISPASAVNLTLTLPDGTTVTGVAESDGSFVFPNLHPGAYHLEASADGFLTSRIDFTLADGQVFVLPPAVLTAGDTNDDNVIDVRDAVLIAANFGGPPLTEATDLNGDGWIDIRDLAIIGAVFGQSGPVPWG